MHRPRRRFGQHFLHDPGVLARIVAAVDPQPGEHLVEIGPGEGALTRPLLERGVRLTVVELDRDLAARLAAWPEAGRRLSVVQGDALDLSLAELAEEGPLRLVGNLPYNVSTPLLFHLLKQAARVRDMHFMLQKEVVARMAARPDTRDYGRLTVMLSMACQVEPLFDVGPGAFRPPPQVRSAVVRLVPRSAPLAAVADPARFAAIVRQAFSMRRKTLRNSLAGLVDEAAMQAAGVDPERRAGELSPEAFARLAATEAPGSGRRYTSGGAGPE